MAAFYRRLTIKGIKNVERGPGKRWRQRVEDDYRNNKAIIMVRMKIYLPRDYVLYITSHFLN